jgi:hypothetical protein
VGAVMSGIGAAITAPFIAATKSFADAGSRLYDLSQRTGLSVEALSALQFAAQQSGTSLDAVEVAIKKMEVGLTKAADGSKEMIGALDDIGLKVSDFQGMNPEQMFAKISGAIAAIPDPARKAAAAVALFGKSGTQLLPMINDFKALEAEGKKLGAVMSTEDAKAADALGDAFGALQAAVTGAAMKIGASLAPSLTALAIRLADTVAAVGGWIDRNREFVVLIAEVGAAITIAGAAVTAFGIAIYAAGAAITAFQNIQTTIALVGKFREAIALAMGTTTSWKAVSLAALTDIRDAWGGLSRGAVSAGSAIVSALTPTRTSLKELGQDAIAMGAIFKKQFLSLGPLLASAFAAIQGASMASIWTSLVAGGTAAFSALGAAAIAAGSAISAALLPVAAIVLVGAGFYAFTAWLADAIGLTEKLSKMWPIKNLGEWIEGPGIDFSPEGEYKKKQAENVAANAKLQAQRKRESGADIAGVPSLPTVSSKVLEAEMANQLSAMQTAYTRGEISLQEYFDKRREIAKRGLDLELGDLLEALAAAETAQDAVKIAAAKEQLALLQPKAERERLDLLNAEEDALKRQTEELNKQAIAHQERTLGVKSAEIQTQSAQLASDYADKKISLEDYYARKQALERQSLENELAALQEEKNFTAEAEKRLDIDAQIAKKKQEGLRNDIAAAADLAAAKKKETEDADAAGLLADQEAAAYRARKAIAESVSAAATTMGTFNLAGGFGEGAISAQDRTAKATEETARNTKRLNDTMKAAIPAFT